MGTIDRNAGMSQLDQTSLVQGESALQREHTESHKLTNLDLADGLLGRFGLYRSQA